MASIKISELESVVELTENDALPIINGNDTKQVTITKLGDILATKDYVNKTISEKADMGFTPLIVESLPTSNIKTNTIYMILGENGKDENVYEEWMYINNKWEKVGSTGNTGGENSYEIIELTANITEPAGTATGNVVKVINSNETDRNNICAFLNNYWDGNNAPTKNLILKKGNIYFILTYTGRATSSGSIGAGFRSQGIVPQDSSKQLYYVEISFDVTGTQGSYKPYFSSSLIYWQGYARFLPYLNKYNTEAYTPSANYHPATKKYVDDSIKNSITSALGGDY